jgi:hypothetical protein
MTAADHKSVSWELLVAVVLLGWLVMALVIATVVGHGTVLGTGSDSDSE